MVSLSMRSARLSGLWASRLDHVRSAGQDPRLRAAQELVAREAHEVDPARHDLRHRRLVREAVGPQIDQAPRAQVLHQRMPRAWAMSASSFEPTSAVKPTTR